MRRTTDTCFLPNQQIIIHNANANALFIILMRTLHNELSAEMDVYVLKVKNPSVDSMSMFPTLEYTR